MEAPDLQEPPQQTPRRGFGKLQPSPESGSVSTNLASSYWPSDLGIKEEKVSTHSLAIVGCVLHMTALVFRMCYGERRRK
jgi:hypothetical protein